MMGEIVLISLNKSFAKLEKFYFPVVCFLQRFCAVFTVFSM